MQVIKRLAIYGMLVFFTAVLAGLGFHAAEKGIQTIVDSDSPPQTIHINQQDHALQVTVLDKQVTPPKLTLGDRWSRELESTKSRVGDTIDQLNFNAGRTLQIISRQIIEWIDANLTDLLHRAVAS